MSQQCEVFIKKARAILGCINCSRVLEVIVPLNSILVNFPLGIQGFKSKNLIKKLEFRLEEDYKDGGRSGNQAVGGKVEGSWHSFKIDN